MDTFARNAFLAIAVIAFISIFTMYFMSQTGAYSWSFGTSSDGYCRCITGPREYGVGGNPYGGQGLEYKGLTTYNTCVDICDGKHSWRSR
jgi:hypothetical protein